MTKWVYTFGDGKAEGQAGMRNLLGGKGANLAEMSNLGLPVPPGFTISTEVCTYYYANGQTYPADLDAQVEAALEPSASITGKSFGDPANPLLVSVRSGARASMPGMMDTVLNLGLNDVTVEALAKSSGDARFAYDSYRRFIQMYSDVVLGWSITTSRTCWTSTRTARATSSTPTSRPTTGSSSSASTRTRSQRELGKPFPQDPEEQLWGAIGAVFGSWNNARAIIYRELHDIPASWGTAVNVQSMVFGNMGETSATGVAFTRNPSTGEKELYGEFLINAQGEDVVAGIRTPQDITEKARIGAGSDRPSLEVAMPEAYAEFIAHLRPAREALPRHAGHRVHHRARQALDAADPQRQAHRQGGAQDRRRAGRRGPDHPARRRSAASIPASLDQLLHPTIDPDAQRTGARHRPARLARRGRRRDRVRRRRRRGGARGRAQGHPRAHRDRRRRTSTACTPPRHPDHPRRHDLARRRGGARHGQALRLRRRQHPRRLRRADA